MEQYDYVAGFDSGSSISKLLLWQRRYVSTDLQILMSHHLISGAVSEIEAQTYAYESQCPATDFGTGTVAFPMNGKLRYYRIGGCVGRTAIAVPKWQSALAKLLCILGWVERKDTGEQRLKGAVRFLLPLNEYAFASTLATHLRGAVVDGYECNGRRVERLQIDSLRCSSEGAGLVSPYAEVSASIVAGHADISFGLALKGAIAPDLSFVIEGAGCLQVLRLSSVPYRSELEGAKAIATGNYKYFATDGLSVTEVKAMVKKAIKTYSGRNRDQFREMRTVLRDYGIETVPYAGGSAEFFQSVIAEGVGVGIELQSPEELARKFSEHFHEQDKTAIARFLDLYGVWKQIPFIEDYLEGLEVIEVPTKKMVEVI
jgi:hypothetical protein